jgi:hypothetical protein
VEPLPTSKRRSGTANRDRLPTCACPFILIWVNSITSLTIQEVKVYLRRQLPTTAGREAIQNLLDRERSEPRRTHDSAMN